mmetsp:Transcript_26367/g.31980  ORF Transcript_26367/g.31980 Transcript_26367/m.31980 type:complete len:95 (-) Transcript_26367:91-375(-)
MVKAGEVDGYRKAITMLLNKPGRRLKLRVNALKSAMLTGCVEAVTVELQHAARRAYLSFSSDHVTAQKLLLRQEKKEKSEQLLNEAPMRRKRKK